jgi:HD-GYP domain-containing protein (c-di-GMP phosphodiesterase class II)
MRYIPLDKLSLELLRIKTPVSPAVNIGRTNVFSGNYQILLAANTMIKKSHIDKLKSMGVTEVCINDPLTNDIIIKNPVDDASISQFGYFVDSIRKKLFPIYHELHEKRYSNSTFTLKFRTYAHSFVCSDPRIASFVKLIHAMFDNFQYEFKRSKVANFVNIIHGNDYVRFHGIFSAFVAAKLFTERGANVEQIKNVFIGTLLQDIGIAPEYYTLKRTTQEEERLFKEHPRTACMIINETPQFNPLMGVAALNHHHYINHSGFPRALQLKKVYNYEKGLHTNGKLASLANAYSALSLFYPPHKVLECLSYIFTNFLFEQEFALLLPSIVNPYPIGYSLELTTGEKVVVKESEHYDKVIVRVIYDADGKRPKDKKDLAVYFHQNTIKGAWYLDEILKERVTPHYPAIILSYLKNNI